MRPPTTFSSNSKTCSGVLGQGLEHALDVGVLARAAGLLLVLVVEFGRLGRRLAVADLGHADCDFDLVFAADSLDVDLQVQLAHAGDDGLAGLFVGGTRNVGSSRMKRCRALQSLSAPSRLIGLMAILITGSAANMLSSVQYLRFGGSTCRRWRSRCP